jgi:hypothetical protein
VHLAGRGLVGKLGYGRHDPAPGHSTIVVSGECELVGSSGAFLERALAITLEHQADGALDVDLGYHSTKLYRCRR